MAGYTRLKHQLNWIKSKFELNQNDIKYKYYTKNSFKIHYDYEDTNAICFDQ